MKTYRAGVPSLQARGQRLVSDHEGNLVHQRLHIARAGRGGAQQRELGLQARVRGNVGILG